jgi:hypothetical protein
MHGKWAKARAQHKARTPPANAPRVYQHQTRRQVATRVQRAAGEALANLQRRQRQENKS